LYHSSDIKPKRVRWAGYIAGLVEVHKHSLFYSKNSNFENRIIPDWPKKQRQKTGTGLKWLKISLNGGIFWWHGGIRIAKQENISWSPGYQSIDKNSLNSTVSYNKDFDW